MWAVLLAGAVVVIGFTYLFATSKQWNQYVTIAGLTAMITLTLILIMELDHPFAGTVSVDSDAFQYVLDHSLTDRP